MFDSALAMHDSLLLSAPEGSHHDDAICPFCTDWAMTSEGIPSGASRLDLADAKAPYGPVKYADPGYQADKVKRYPVDTEAHAKAAWSYIHQAVNADKYSADELSKIRTVISEALEQFGVEKQAAENAPVQKPKSNSDTNSGKPSASSKTKSDAAMEGGTKQMDTDTQETISKETHEALLDKALRDSTAALEAEKASLTEQVATLTASLAAKTDELASANAENERINGELDTAQVALKTAQDESASLKADIAAKEEETAKAEIASARAAQVRNLGLFTEEYITERASRWADVEEAAWTERLDEWKVAKGTSAASSKSTDTASAMTGTRDVQSGGEPSARRLALGLA